MSVLVEDTPRNNLAAWAGEAVRLGYARGAVLSPFSSPLVGNTYKPSAHRIVEQLLDAGAAVWLDPATHALQMPGVGDFRYYDGWDLWGGARGDLTTPANRRDHVLRVLAAQADLGLDALGPTVLLHNPIGGMVDAAISMADEAISADSSAWLTVAGSPAFWSSEDELDGFIGAIAQLGSQGFFLVVARPIADLPVAASPVEVAGICRTARSLEQFGEVHISHGDFAALPAVAAGATSVGTGWDSRQRVCNYTSYAVRDPTGGGGGWFKRPSYQGLFGFLARADAERMAGQDSVLAARLHPGNLHPDAPKEAFLHHVQRLSIVTQELGQLDFEPAYHRLRDWYLAAITDWPIAALAASISSMEDKWITPFLRGLESYAGSEGWA